ncbi:hypothetical protein TNCV_2491151, partial [Trichonephila clavipes]
FTCRNCGGEIEVVSPSIVPLPRGVSPSLNRAPSPVWCLKANDRRSSAHMPR